jgi:flagellin
MAKSLSRLSSGYRISKAADDAAGLAISEKMKAQIGGLQMAERNAQDGISLIQTAEGGLAETSSILLRMRDLANQATTATLDVTDRSKITEEFDALKTELGRIADSTKFNGTTLLDGGLGSTINNAGDGLTVAKGIVNIQSTGATPAAGYKIDYDSGTKEMTVTAPGVGGESQKITIGTLPSGFTTKELSFTALGIKVTISAALEADITADNTFDVTIGAAGIQVGADGNTWLNVSIANMSDGGLGVDAAAVDDSANAATAVGLIDVAIGKVNTQRAKLGAYQNRLEHTIANLGTTIENLTSAESRIKDVDMALEMASFTKGQILQQAGTAMLAQANQRPQSIMQLLR